MGHTPGPWTLECEDDDGELYQDGVRIDSPEGPVAFNVIDCSAPLIAAAPDLLAALKALVEASQWEGEVAWLRKLWPQVNAALDKAEGTDGQDRSMD